MFHKRFNLVVPKFLEEFEGGGGGGNPEPQAAPAPAPAPAPAFDTEALGRSLAANLKPLLPQPVEPQLTPEQARAQLNYWEPDDAFIAEFDNLDTKKQALGKLRDGLTKQMVTIVQALLNDHGTKLTSKYDPIVELVNKREAEGRETRFFSSYSQLSDPAFRPAIAAVVQHLASAGQLSGDEAANFKAIASGVEALVKQSNPTFTLNQQQPGGTNPRNGNGIPVTTPGGGGGGGNSGNQGAKPKSVALQFL